MMTSAMHRTWQRRVNLREASTAQIRQLVAVAFGHGRRTNLTPGEAADILATLRTRPIGLPAADEVKGLAWLAGHGAGRLGISQADAEAAVSITFAGGCLAYSDRTSLPIWVVTLTDGRSFRYWAASWQARTYGSGHVTDRDEWMAWA